MTSQLDVDPIDEWISQVHSLLPKIYLHLDVITLLKKQDVSYFPKDMILACKFARNNYDLAIDNEAENKFVLLLKPQKEPASPTETEAEEGQESASSRPAGRPKGRKGKSQTGAAHGVTTLRGKFF